MFCKCYTFLVYVNTHYFIFLKTLFNTLDKSLLKSGFVTVKMKWTTDNPYIQMQLQSTGETVYWGEL